jgi:phage repressor protein C with HTH and peptisase S24 domain
MPNMTVGQLVYSCSPRIHSLSVAEVGAGLPVAMPRASRPVTERLLPLSAGFGQRVRGAAQFAGTLDEAATAMGVVYDQLRRIMNEEAVPSFPSIAALSRHSGFALEWLAFGVGSQFKDEGLSPRTSYSGAEGTAAQALENRDTILVRRFDLRAAVGAGEDVTGDAIATVLPFSRRYLEDVLRCSVEDVAMGEASGDAMEPTIGDRDLVMVNTRKKTISNGAIFVLRLANELVVKRVQRDPDGSVLLVSDNKNYGERRLTQDEVDQVDVIGRMIWSGGAL